MLWLLYLKKLWKDFKMLHSAIVIVQYFHLILCISKYCLCLNLEKSWNYHKILEKGNSRFDESNCNSSHAIKICRKKETLWK